MNNMLKVENVHVYGCLQSPIHAANLSAAIDKMLVSENTDPLDEFLDRAEKED